MKKISAEQAEETFCRLHKQKADTIVEEVKEKKVIDKEHETKLLLRLTSVKVLLLNELGWGIY